MSELHSIIPGLSEAEARQDQLRDSAFLALPVKLCGLPCAELTVRRFAILIQSRNPFVCGGFPLPEDVAMFLWAMDPSFSYTDAAARDARIEACKSLDYHAAVAEIRAFIEEVFLDSPPSSGVAGESLNSWMASLVDILAREYGWTQSEVLDLPMPCVFQYTRIINRRISPNTPQFNRLTDAAKNKWLNEQAQRARN